MEIGIPDWFDTELVDILEKKLDRTGMKKRERREGALARLENQLTSKTKTKKKSFEKIGLTDKDLKRIKTEVEVLKKRVV